MDATPGVVSELLSASPGSDFIPSDAGGIHIVNETHMYGWQPSSLLGCLNLFCISVTSMGPMGLMQVDNRMRRRVASKAKPESSEFRELSSHRSQPCVGRRGNGLPLAIAGK